MDFEALRTFVDCVKTGSFSEAARVLSVSQPTVSRRIRALEDELDAQLFDRSGSSITPTRAGLDLLSFAERVLADYDRTFPRKPVKPSISGTLHIATSTTPGEYLVPALLALFSKEWPGIETSLHIMDSKTVEECVMAKHCDLGFLGRPPGRSRLAHWQVVEDEIVLAVSSHHEWLGRDEVAIDELAGQPFVERQPGSGTRATVEQALTTCGRRLPPRRVVVEVNSVQAQLAAIARGQGIGFVSRVAAQHHADAIHTLRVAGITLRRGLHMLYDPKRDEPAYRTFVRFVEAHGETLVVE